MSDPLFNQGKAKVKKVKEVSVEDRVVRYARAKGWFVAKVNFPGIRGAADRILIKNGKTIFMEFKRPKGGKVSPLQLRFKAKMNAHLIPVWFVDNAEKGKLLIDGYQ
jgi:hypothetical protein